MNKTVRFFWIGEESEVFAAESFEQLLADSGKCGTGIASVRDGNAYDDRGEYIETGEYEATDIIRMKRIGKGGAAKSVRGTWQWHYEAMLAARETMGTETVLPELFHTAHA